MGTIIGELGMAVQGNSSHKVKGSMEHQPYRDFFSPKASAVVAPSQLNAIVSCSISDNLL